MSPQPVVFLDRISFIRDHISILHEISLCIEKGQHWAIIGPNGSGKTSLISIINGYHQPSEGKAEVLGCRFGKTDLRELRLHIGEAGSEIRNMLHPHDSIMSIVLSGKFASIGLYEMPSLRDRERAGKLLDFFGLSGMAQSPFNILSCGEQQKVIIARALMPEPELLVLDEPCAGLDMGAREDLLDSVQEMCEDTLGPTLILVTHHIEEIVPAITHALVLKQGRMVAMGAKKNVLTADVLSRTFDLPIDIQETCHRMWPVVLKNKYPVDPS